MLLLEEPLIHQSEPTLKNLLWRGMAIIVWHLVQLDSSALELPSKISGFTYSDNVSDMMLTTLLDIQVEVLLARRVHNDEAEGGN